MFLDSRLKESREADRLQEGNSTRFIVKVCLFKPKQLETAKLYTNVCNVYRGRRTHDLYIMITVLYIQTYQSRQIHSSKQKTK